MGGLLDYFSGEKTDNWEDALKLAVGGLGYVVKDRADEMADWQPKWYDQPTDAEKYATSALVPSRSNGAVQKAAFQPRGNAAATAAAQRRAQTQQVGKVAAQAPPYWQKLMGLASSLRDAANNIQTTSALNAYSSKAVSGAVGVAGGSAGSSTGGYYTPNTDSTYWATPQQSNAVPISTGGNVDSAMPGAVSSNTNFGYVGKTFGSDTPSNWYSA